MNEAPKELWADWDYDETDGVCGVHTGKRFASYCEPDLPPIRYVREDLIDAKREWVGLTEVEIRYALREWAETNQTCREMMYAIEAKLKEKNT